MAFITFALHAYSVETISTHKDNLHPSSDLRSIGKIENPQNGTFHFGDVLLIVAFSDDKKVMEFTSNIPVHSIQIRSGVNSYQYDYSGTLGDGGLKAPANYDGNQPTISFVEFFSNNKDTPNPLSTPEVTPTIRPYLPSSITLSSESRSFDPQNDRDKLSRGEPTSREKPTVAKTPSSKAKVTVAPDTTDTPPQPSPVHSGSVRVIESFNGVTLDSAIMTSAEIDQTAESITKDATTSHDKGNILYKWVSANIKYDYDKATKLNASSKGLVSVAISTYSTRTGICFDYSCLYIAMCRKAGLKVRFIAGQGYTGSVWENHAWNQVFNTDTSAWINVDTTFGHSVGNYFERSGFNKDHRNAIIKGEW